MEFIKVKPISKNKHWRISKVLGQDFAEIAGVQLKEQAEKQIEEVMPEEKENKQSLPSGGGEQVIVDSEQTEEIKEKASNLKDGTDPRMVLSKSVNNIISSLIFNKRCSLEPEFADTMSRMNEFFKYNIILSNTYIQKFFWYVLFRKFGLPIRI